MGRDQDDESADGLLGLVLNSIEMVEHMVNVARDARAAGIQVAQNVRKMGVADAARCMLKHAPGGLSKCRVLHCLVDAAERDGLMNSAVSKVDEAWDNLKRRIHPFI